MTRKAEKPNLCKAIDMPSVTKLGQSCPMADEDLCKSLPL
jgi:hypothetical protein